MSGWFTNLPAGISVSLDGDIGINYYAQIDESVKDTAFILFTLENGSVREVTAADVTPQTVSSLGEGVFYKFTCRVTAAEMTQKVTAQLFRSHADLTGGTAKTFSVKDYSELLLGGSYSDATKELVKAMLNYGGYVQTNFSRNTGTLASRGLYTPETDPVLTGNDWDLTAYKPSRTGSATGFALQGASLALDSETALRLYYTLDPGKTLADYTITVNGTNQYTMGSNSNDSYLEITNIAANAIHTSHNVSILPVGEASGLTLVYSPLSYARTILEGSYTENETLMMKALVLYSRAAENYMGG